jgi:hypothetical protein
MHQTIYILRDGNKTKIGQTQDWGKRANAYNTHNPNYLLHKKYECSCEQAQNIEKKIKLIFKDERSGLGQEWFNVEAHVVESIVDGILGINPSSSDKHVAHRVPINRLAEDLMVELKKEAKKNDLYTDKATALKEKLQEHFSKALNLGIPFHKLPTNVIHEEELSIDPIHCDRKNERYDKTFNDNYIQIHQKDHASNFYEVFTLATGHSICIATAMLTMPYGSKTSEEDQQKHIQAASDLGLTVSFRDEWSWHNPGSTGLILYQMKTPRADYRKLFDSSLRKWVIENSELLKQIQCSSATSMKNAVRDISCDITFPLNIENLESITEYYPWCDYMDAYEKILEKWKDSKSLNVNSIDI